MTGSMSGSRAAFCKPLPTTSSPVAKLLLLVTTTILFHSTSSAAPVCTENAVAVINNWGWENGGSCQVAASACVDTAPVGDGWGWNGATSCRVTGSSNSTSSGNTSTGNTSSGNNLLNNAAECFDSPPVGDGWGWNGTDSCVITTNSLAANIANAVVNTGNNASTSTPQPLAVEDCIDTPPVGDGWGWNDTGTCAVVWSIASYPGWTQLVADPSTIPYRHFSHIMHFAMYPTHNGELSLGDIFTEENADRAVSAAHAANTKILLVVGGEGEGDKFVGATHPARIAGFVDQIVQRMQKHNYDGISLDWEEEVIDERLIELTQRLANRFAQITPRPLLTIDVLSNFVSGDLAAEVAPYVDSVNIMSYFVPNRIENEFAFYQSAGVPANKVVMGIGLFPDADDNPTRVVQKMRYARRLGFKGTELWSVQFADWDGPLFTNYVNNQWR